MRSTLVAALLLFTACPAATHTDSGTPDPVDSGMTIDPPDAGLMVRNLTSDVPVQIDFILPFKGGLRAEDWGVDPQGNVVLAGNLSGVVDLDPTDGAQEVDLGLQSAPVVISLDRDGHFRWARAWKDRRGGPQPVRVAVGPSGDVYMMSTVTSGPPDPLFDLDPTEGEQLVDTRSVRALFVVHLSVDGAFLGGFVTTGDNIVDTPGFITVGQDGRVWLTAWFQGIVDLDPSNAYLILNSGGMVPNIQRKEFVARYEADLRVIWGFIPSTRSINSIFPVDGGALFTGTYGGGTDFMSVRDADLDQGPGLDVHFPGCIIRSLTSECSPQSYFGRMTNNAEVEWTATYNRVNRNRRDVEPTNTSGGPIARPEGDGLILGVTRDSADFDWTSSELVYSAPWHQNDIQQMNPDGGNAVFIFPDGEVVPGPLGPEFFDVFAQGVTASGKPMSLTRTRTLRMIDGLNEAAWTNGSGTWSPADDSYFATGWTQGVVVFPSMTAGGVGRPVESFIASFDPTGRLRWTTGLGVSNGLGGDGAARVRSDSRGRTFILGRAAAFTDLDFTPGLFFADGGSPDYLLGFHVKPCVEGALRQCKCQLQVVQDVTASCVSGQYEPCACSQENIMINGTIPPRPTPDCGTCAAGWTCNPATWLCEDPGQMTLASGLNHPTAVLDDGTHVYFSLQGRYPRITPPPAQSPVGEMWRVPSGGGTPEQLSDAGAVSGLQLYDGYIYWAQQGLFRTPSGGDGGVELVVSNGLLKAPLTFHNGNAYWVNGNQVMRQPLDGGTAATSGVLVGANAIRGVSADTNHVYALAEAGGAGGLYRLAHTAWGGAGWQRQTNGTDPRAMVQLGTSIYFSDLANQSVNRFDTVTQQTSLIVSSFGEVNSFSTDGTRVYFTRFGVPAASTWTGEVWRIEAGTTPPTLIASSIQHASFAFVRGTRLVFAEHGETRASTTTGRIGAVQIR